MAKLAPKTLTNYLQVQSGEFYCAGFEPSGSDTEINAKISRNIELEENSLLPPPPKKKTLIGQAGLIAVVDRAVDAASEVGAVAAHRIRDLEIAKFF